ncbi:hypothetical protein BDQ17DRAFT_304521 [Cyathus striatus]|nr:hypothetical protein BDQ17DRAFT_304521 [Cyathus striatus]
MLMVPGVLHLILTCVSNSCYHLTRIIPLFYFFQLRVCCYEIAPCITCWDRLQATHDIGENCGTSNLHWYVTTSFAWGRPSIRHCSPDVSER